MAKQLDERVRILSTWPPGAECAQVHICYPLRQTAAPAAQKEKHNGRTFGDKRCRGSRKWTSDELTPWPNMYWLADPETVRQQACSGAEGAMQSSLSAEQPATLQPCVPPCSRNVCPQVRRVGRLEHMGYVKRYQERLMTSPEYEAAFEAAHRAYAAAR